MPFCQDCGAKLDAGAQFCTDCGAPVLDVQEIGAIQPASSELPPSRTDPEKIVAVIPNLMKVRGLFLKGPSWHHVMVTPDRVIVVQRSLKRLERYKQDIGIRGPDDDHYYLKSMTPGEILEENPESQVIPLVNLVNITVSKIVSYSSDGTQCHWQVLITTKKETLTLRTDYDEDPGKYFRNPELIEMLGTRLLLTEM